MYKITKEFKFEAAHLLRGLSYDSPCKNIHGHSYKVFVTIEVDKLNKDGMVIDFSFLRKFQDFLDENFDHSLIISYQTSKESIEMLKSFTNRIYIFPHSNVTAEYMTIHFYQEIYPLVTNELDDNQILNAIEITVFETEKNSASFRKEFDEFDDCKEIEKEDLSGNSFNSPIPNLSFPPEKVKLRLEIKQQILNLIDQLGSIDLED